MQGLAYEIVINSNPCIAYLMEENSMTMQALVIAHACYGHNSFFKGNYLFRQWTDADGVLDYLVFARKYVMDCEDRYGIDAVEADVYKRQFPGLPCLDVVKARGRLEIRFRAFAAEAAAEGHLGPLVNVTQIDGGGPFRRVVDDVAGAAAERCV